MAATGLALTLDFAASGRLTKDDGVSAAVDPVASASKDFPAMAGDFSFGTGALLANTWYRAKRTLAGSTGESIDLAGGITNPFGETITFTRIVAVIVAIVEPNGTKAVRVGPAAVSNAWVGPFGSGNDYVTVKYWQAFVDNSAAGFTVTAGTGDLLRISNPGATSLDYIIWVVGNG